MRDPEVVVELPNGDIETGTRDPVTNDLVLPGIVPPCSGQPIRVNGAPASVAWCGYVTLEGPTLVGVTARSRE